MIEIDPIAWEFGVVLFVHNSGIYRINSSDVKIEVKGWFKRTPKYYVDLEDAEYVRENEEFEE